MRVPASAVRLLGQLRILQGSGVKFGSRDCVLPVWRGHFDHVLLGKKLEGLEECESRGSAPGEKKSTFGTLFEAGILGMGKKKRPSSDENVQGAAKEETADGKDLYAVLGVDRSASQDEIRKAYHRLALRLHPDKNPGDENAKDKFQSLQSVIAILGDPEKRKVYDDTGSVEDVELSGDTITKFYQFFKSLYKQVTEDDIATFAASYRGSEEELENLKDEYRRRKGDMNLVFTYIMCSNPKLDSHRFMDMIDSAISAGELKEFKVYRKWAKEVSKEPAPLNPLAQPSRKKDEGQPSSGLLALIKNKSKDRMNSLASALEAKYCGGKKKRDSKIEQEPSEEEFLAIQKRYLKKTKRKGAKQD